MQRVAGYGMINEQDVLAQLEAVIHPTFGMSIVTLNMVRTIAVNEQGIQLKMVMDCPGCPAGRVTIAQTHRVLRSLLASNELEIAIELLPERWQAPWEIEDG